MKCNLNGLNISFHSKVMAKIIQICKHQIIQAGANTKSQHMQGVSKSVKVQHMHESTCKVKFLRTCLMMGSGKRLNLC